MPLDNPPPTNSRGDKLAVPFKKLALRAVDATHKAWWNVESTIEQNASIVRDAPLPVGKVD